MKHKFMASIILMTMFAAIFLYSIIQSAATHVPGQPLDNPLITVSPAQQDGWKTHTITEIGLTFRAPAGVEVHGEQFSDAGTYVFYAERGAYPEPAYYQLYAIVRPALGQPYTEQDLEQFKGELVPDSVRDFEVDGYKAVDGQLKGERNRFATRILRGSDFIELYTSQPTQKNRKLTDAIVKTFDFE